LKEHARRLGHRYVGTEHLVLGLIKINDGLVPQVLPTLGVSGSDLRASIIRRDRKAS